MFTSRGKLVITLFLIHTSLGLANRASIYQDLMEIVPEADNQDELQKQKIDRLIMECKEASKEINALEDMKDQLKEKLEHFHEEMFSEYKAVPVEVKNKYKPGLEHVLTVKENGTTYHIYSKYYLNCPKANDRVLITSPRADGDPPIVWGMNSFEPEEERDDDLVPYYKRTLLYVDYGHIENGLVAAKCYSWIKYKEYSTSAQHVMIATDFKFDNEDSVRYWEYNTTIEEPMNGKYHFKVQVDNEKSNFKLLNNEMTTRGDIAAEETPDSESKMDI